MIQEFKLTSNEEALLDDIGSSPLVRIQCLGVSKQDAVPEPGIFCQAVVLRTATSELVVKPTCEEFGDLEIFWLSIASAQQVNLAEYRAQARSVQIAPDALGTVRSWEKIRFTIRYERKEKEPLDAQLDFGILFHLEDRKRLLILRAGLPFFVQFFSDSDEIDGALASIAQAQQ